MEQKTKTDLAAELAEAIYGPLLEALMKLNGFKRHAEPHKWAGKTVRARYDGREVDYRVQDWSDRVHGEPWAAYRTSKLSEVQEYADRGKRDGLPPDNEVVLGTIGGLTVMLHASELIGSTEDAPEPADSPEPIVATFKADGESCSIKVWVDPEGLHLKEPAGLDTSAVIQFDNANLSALLDQIDDQVIGRNFEAWERAKEDRAANGV